MSPEMPDAEHDPVPPEKRAGSPISDPFGLMWDLVNRGWGTTLRLLVIMIPVAALLVGLVLLRLVQVGWGSLSSGGDREQS